MTIIEYLTKEEGNIHNFEMKLRNLVQNPPDILSKLSELGLRVSSINNFDEESICMSLFAVGNERFAHKAASILDAPLNWTKWGYWKISSDHFHGLFIYVVINPDATCEIEYADEVVKRAIGVKCQPIEV